MLKKLGSPIRRLVTLALVAMMMSASILTPGPVSAQGQSIQSSLTGVTINYGSPYELMEDGVYSDDMMESMIFLGPADMLAMGFMTPLIDLNGARDVMLEILFGETGTAVTIDRGDYTGVSYSLDMLNVEGMEMGVFSLFMNQRSHGHSEFYIFLAPPALFASAMQTAQNTFTINGSPLMDGVDAAVMGSMVTANTGSTGGTAVTDVTDVAQTADNTSETTETTDITETEGLDENEGDNLAYAMLVMAEYTTVDDAIGTIFELLGELDDGTSDAATVRPLLDEQYEILADTNSRLAAIEVPVGMQDFHQQTIAWGDAVTLAGTKWFDFVQGRTDSTDASNALIAALEIHAAFGESLQAVPLSSGTSGDTGTTETPGNQTDTRTTTAGGDSVDANEYLTTVQDHRGVFFFTFIAFDSLLTEMSDNPTDARVGEIREETIGHAETWITFESAAASTTPPPGYEGVHQEYLAWAAEVTELGNLWIGAMNQDGTTADQFYDQLDVVLAADTSLEEAIAASGGEAQTTETSETTETGTNSRSSRTTATGTEESTTTTTRSNRSSRTTTTATETPEATETSSRSSRTTRGGERTPSENTSETSGRVGQTTQAANSWLMEQTGVTFTWSDDFEFSDTAENPQVSDPEAGEDVIYLQREASNGVLVRFNVSVYPNTQADATSLVNGLVNDTEALVEVFGPEAEVVDHEITSGESAAVVRAVDEYGVYWVYAQVTCVTSSCDTLAFVLIVADAEPFVETLAAMEDGIAIDGQSITSAIPVTDVESIVDQLGE